MDTQNLGAPLSGAQADSIALPHAPHDMDTTPRFIAEWKMADHDQRYNYRYSETGYPYVPVTLMGQVLLKRTRLRSDHNEYAFLDAVTGKSIYTNENYQFKGKLEVRGSYEERVAFHQLMLYIAWELSALLDWSAFTTLTSEQRQEVGRLAKEVVETRLADPLYSVARDPGFPEQVTAENMVPCSHCGTLHDALDLADRGSYTELCEECQGILEECQNCRDAYSFDPSSEESDDEYGRSWHEVDDIGWVCGRCSEDLNYCDRCGYESFSENEFNYYDDQQLCDSCYEKAGRECDECDFTSHDDDDFFFYIPNNTHLCEECYERHKIECDQCSFRSMEEDDFMEWEGQRLCPTCFEEVVVEATGMPAEKLCLVERYIAGRSQDQSVVAWLEDNRFARAYDGRGELLGYYVYKTFNSSYRPPSYWTIAPNSVLEEKVDTDHAITCGAGINVGGFAWVRNHAWVDEGAWKCLLKLEDIEGAVVPYNTDGKFRVARLTLLHKVTTSGRRILTREEVLERMRLYTAQQEEEENQEENQEA